jgi:large subunit ribosomal protein L21
MKYAVIKTGGKQYKVAEGDVIAVERMAALTPKSNHTFDEVLLFVEDGVVKIGSPKVTGVTVKADVVDHIKGEKIRVSKYKSKVRYRRVKGHRQALTQLKISEIASGSAKKETVAKASDSKPAKRARTTQK